MVWNWHNIDWFATTAAVLLLAAVLVASLALQTLPPVSGMDTTAKRERRARLQQRWLRAWLLAAIALALSSSLIFLAGSIHHDKHGVYGSDTAAWVQAIGSIGAILGARRLVMARGGGTDRQPSAGLGTRPQRSRSREVG